MRKVQIGKSVDTRFKFEESAESFTKEMFSEDDFSEGESFIGNITVDGKVINDGSSLKVTGKIYCRKKFICDRCLENAQENQVHNFDEEIDETQIVDGLFDLSELVRDTLLAAQPIQNLCKADCKGLCPTCGKNLNNDECDCEKSTIDPRLSPFLKFVSGDN